MAERNLLESAKQKMKKLPLEVVDGVVLLKNRRIPNTEAHIRSIKSLPLKDGDILICGFPRSGHYWMFEILHFLLENQYTDRFFSDHVLETSLNLQEQVETLESPRIFATYLNPKFLPECIQTKDIKIIYTFRNPKDVFLSFFMMYTAMPRQFLNYTGSWDEFFELMISGDFIYGSWFDFTEQWHKFVQENPQKGFFAQFEKLRENPEEVIREICLFLGWPTDVSESVALAASFENVNRHTQEKQQVENLKWSTKEIESWKSRFSVLQSKRVDVLFDGRFDENNVVHKSVKPYIV